MSYKCCWLNKEVHKLLTDKAIELDLTMIKTIKLMLVTSKIKKNDVTDEFKKKDCGTKRYSTNYYQKNKDRLKKLRDAKKVKIANE